MCIRDSGTYMKCSWYHLYLCFVESHHHFQAIVAILVSLFYESSRRCHWTATVFYVRFCEMHYLVSWWSNISDIGRLNSGIFSIFNLRVWNLDLTSSDCRASEIIWNDTEPDAISWESRRENSIFNFRVGKTMCGHRPASLNLFYDGVF